MQTAAGGEVHLLDFGTNHPDRWRAQCFFHYPEGCRREITVGGHPDRDEVRGIKSKFQQSRAVEVFTIGDSWGNPDHRCRLKGLSLSGKYGSEGRNGPIEAITELWTGSIFCFFSSSFCGVSYVAIEDFMHCARGQTAPG